MSRSPSEGADCPKCWARLDTPLFCETCDSLLEAGHAHSPFQALGMGARFRVDRMALRKRLLALSRRMHPDFHAAGQGGQRELAERNTAALNSAFKILSDDVRRANWLLESLGGPSESDERQVPAELLMQAFEWNEAIEAARAAAAGMPEHAALDELNEELLRERERVMNEVAELLSPLPENSSPALLETRQRLNAARYIDRALRQIAELRLERQSQTS